jgi:hypothetical protein
MKSESSLLSVFLLVPLADRSTIKKEVILGVKVGLGCGCRVWEQNLRTSLMFNV